MVKQSIEAKVRPLSSVNLEKASLSGAAHLYVSKDTLISLTGALDGGRACVAERLHERLPEGEGEEQPLRREASLWVLPEKNISPNVVMMTRAFQEATGFKIGDQVRVSLIGGNEKGSTADAGEIVVRDITEALPTNSVTYRYPAQWEYPVSLVLGQLSISMCAMLNWPGVVLISSPC